MAQGMKDMEMPAPAGAPSEEEEFDFGFEGEEGAEESASTELDKVSDDDLIAEMQKRGFEVEDEPEEDLGEEVGPESDIMGEEPIV